MVAPSTSSEPRAFALAIPEGDCSLAELRRVLVDYRNWVRTTPFDRTAALSNAGLGKLLELAYLVSLRKEEGRYLTMRFFVDRPGRRSPMLAEFDRPVQLASHALLKLAPAVGSLEHALHVVEARAGDAPALFCDGIASLIDLGLDEMAGSVPGRPENVSSFPGGLLLTVDGPGILRVYEGLSVEYAAGKLDPAWPYGTIRPVQESFVAVAESVLDRLAARHGEEARAHFGGVGVLAAVVEEFWSQILQTALAARHGATFVLLPDRELPDVAIRYQIRPLDLRDCVYEFWEACVVAHMTAEGDTLDRDAVLQWQRAKVRMRAVARAVGNLSQVDGCVVLTSQLQVLGFGAVIGGRGPSDQVCQCTVAHPRTLEPEGYVSLSELGLGTRHQSAYRVCDEQAGAIAYVVSQDGGVRLFFSDADRIYMWRIQGLRGAVSEGI